MKSVLLFLFVAATAKAQLSLLPENLKAVPALPILRSSSLQDSHIQKFKKLFTHAVPVQIYSEDQFTQLASILDSQFQKSLAPLSSQAPACENKEIENYLLALQVAGRYADCAKLAASCQNKTTGPKPFMIAALCESTRYIYSNADLFFELATDPKWSTSPDYLESIFQRASYSLYGHHEDQVDGILSQIPNSTPEDRKMWKALLQRAGEIDTGDITKEQVDQFLQSQILVSQGSFKSLLLSLQIRIAQRDSHYEEALDSLLIHGNELINPLHWYYVAYSTLYYGLDQNFAWARKIYDVYNHYANPWMSLPLEGNTYNYTEIYNDICPNQLIQPSQNLEFEKVKSDLRTGQVSIADALGRLDILRSRFLGKADFLTVYANLLSLQGRHLDAFNMYWDAHTLCPYYNRANWGLSVEKRFAQFSGRPDYNYLNSKIDRELAGRVIPQAISTYIVNWNSLNADIQKHVAFGARIWMPYMQTMEQNQSHTYIKFAYELLSEAPELSDVRDQRIGGENYPYDNRLWDDVRGVGGSMVVGDLAEVYQSAQGDYNLLGHEMAHQFQYILEKIDPTGLDCIVRQYAQAKAIKNFPDSYSSQNMEEHFAQGVTYYLVPADSPARFGLNQNWVKRNNSAQFDFIQSIDYANGDFSKITCVR